VTAHVEQITPEDTALPVWVIYEGETCDYCGGRGRVGIPKHNYPPLTELKCPKCGGSDRGREIARATSEADAERVAEALRLLASLDEADADLAAGRARTVPEVFASGEADAERVRAGLGCVEQLEAMRDGLDWIKRKTTDQSIEQRAENALNGYPATRPS
jgi:hypothetical protein